MSDRRSGFTIIEVLIALILLSVGVLALTSSAASVTRMLTNGAFKTKSYSISQARIDNLRTLANRTNPKCTDPGVASGSRTNAGYAGFGEAWTVTTTGTGGNTRTVWSVVTYRAGPKLYRDSTNAIILCT